jgi:hypothetical protein
VKPLGLDGRNPGNDENRMSSDSATLGSRGLEYQDQSSPVLNVMFERRFSGSSVMITY